MARETKSPLDLCGISQPLSPFLGRRGWLVRLEMTLDEYKCCVSAILLGGTTYLVLESLMGVACKDHILKGQHK